MSATSASRKRLQLNQDGGYRVYRLKEISAESACSSILRFRVALLLRVNPSHGHACLRMMKAPIHPGLPADPLDRPNDPGGPVPLESNALQLPGKHVVALTIHVALAELSRYKRLRPRRNRGMVKYLFHQCPQAEI